MRHTLFVLLVVILLGFVACSQETVPTPVVTPAIVPTATQIVRPPTATPPATATAVPTDQPSPTPTITPTATPTSTPTNTPIPETAVEAITLVPIVTEGLTKPTYLTHANDDRLFVLEQAGRVRIIKDGQLLEEPFLDISERVDSVELEQGLLGLAFHPDYESNGRFFLDYSNPAGDTHISSFLVDPNDPNRADPASEIVLLTIAQPHPNHNGGQIAFGPDGYLYIGMGDGGSHNDPDQHGQNANSLLGTILRLDVDHDQTTYAIPADNPFISDDEKRNEIWAYGLRNPWRFSFDSLSGDLFISDVGEIAWEEINWQTAAAGGGQNYGWNAMEGSQCFQGSACDPTGLELPIFEYDHTLGCSITGGYVYRGQQFLELYGNYILADFCQGTFWRLFPEIDGSWSTAVVLDTEWPISSLGEDAAGELYALNHNGAIYQIQP